MVLSLAASLAILAFADEKLQEHSREGIQFQMSAFQLERPNWRPWEIPGEKASNRKSSLSRRAQMPSATVEVVESSDLERHQRLFEFMARTAPVLMTAYEFGYESRTNKQMLSEFMAQDPSHPHPPSVPSVFYNNFKPPLENPALVEKKR
ncbi:MAG: hypothetical protein IPP78_13380 [Holophagaceae bacterium]|nr:hypothetical protein [Holophagaceae bacterium]